MFGLGQLQVGKFLARRRRLFFRSLGCRGTDQRPLLWRRRTGLRIPRGLGVDLGLAQAGKILGDRFLVVQAEMFGVGTDEAFVENAAGEQIKVLFFDGLQHARADLGDVGDIIEREVALLARVLELVSELAHRDPARAMEPALVMTASS